VFVVAILTPDSESMGLQLRGDASQNWRSIGKEARGHKLRGSIMNTDTWRNHSASQDRAHCAARAPPRDQPPTRAGTEHRELQVTYETDACRAIVDNESMECTFHGPYAVSARQVPNRLPQ